MRLLFVHRIGISLWLLGAAAGLAACAKDAPIYAPAPVTFRSEHFPYAVAYDLNRWRILATAERDIVMAQSDMLLSGPEAVHFIGVTVERSSASTAELKTRALIALQQKGPDLKVVAQNPITVAGAPALQVQLQATIRESRLAFELVFVQYGGYAYQLAYWAAADRFLDREPDFRDFVSSFQPRSPLTKAATANVAYPSPQAGYIITLPAPEWRQSAERLSNDADQQFETHTSLSYLMIIAERLPISVGSLAERGVARLRQSSQGRFKVTETEDVTVDGMPAKIVFGETSLEGTLYKHAILFVVREGRAYQVAAWAPADLFQERYRKQFVEIFLSLQFLS